MGFISDEVLFSGGKRIGLDVRGKEGEHSGAFDWDFVLEVVVDELLVDGVEVSGGGVLVNLLDQEVEIIV